MLTEADKIDLVERMEERFREVLVAQQGMMTSQEVANYLQVSLKRWQEMYRQNPRLKRAALPLGGRGEGEELRWDISEVKKALRGR